MALRHDDCICKMAWYMRRMFYSLIIFSSSLRKMAAHGRGKVVFVYLTGELSASDIKGIQKILAKQSKLVSNHNVAIQ